MALQGTKTSEQYLRSELRSEKRVLTLLVTESEFYFECFERIYS